MEDGTAKVIEKVRFENNLTYNEKVKKYIDILNLEARNIRIYGINILGKHKISFVEAENYIAFDKSIIYDYYEIEYTTKQIVKKFNDKYAFEFPFAIDYRINEKEIVKNTEKEKNNKIETLPGIIEKEKKEKEWQENIYAKWVNNYSLNITFNNDIHMGEVRTLVNGLPTSNLKIYDKSINLKVVNMPKMSEVDLYMIIPENTIKKEYGEKFEKIVFPTPEELVEKHETRFQTFKTRKEKRDYISYIYKKYLLYAVYILITYQILDYIIRIIGGIIENGFKFKKDDIKENFKANIGDDLIKAYALYDRDIYVNRMETKNLIEAIIMKLNVYGYITVKDENIEINYKKEEEIKKLNYIDKYILEKIYVADKNNDSKLDYIELNKEFRLSSAEIITEIYEEIEKEKQKFLKEGIYRRTDKRVDFSMILILIPVLILYTMYDYINPYIAVTIFIITYLMAKFANICQKDGYTKKGMKLRHNLDGYEKYLGSLGIYLVEKKKAGKFEKLEEKLTELRKKVKLFSRPKIVDTEENAIYRVFFGQGNINKNGYEKIKEMTESICSYLNVMKNKF
ncbi:MAG: hypothetical protein HXK70_04370 [Clostridiales bacterium]|nr:hypothetical protein [Clostridiales bacterium]